MLRGRATPYRCAGATRQSRRHPRRHDPSGALVAGGKLMPVRTVGRRQVLWRTIVGDIKHAARRPREFNQILRDLWPVAKGFAARGITSVELRQIDGLGEKPMTGYFDDPQRLIVAALCDSLGAKT